MLVGVAVVMTVMMMLMLLLLLFCFCVCDDGVNDDVDDVAVVVFLVLLL